MTDLNSAPRKKDGAFRWLIFCMAGLFSACSTSAPMPLLDSSNRYQSDTGSERVRSELKNNLDSIVRIQTGVLYITHHFDSQNLPAESELSGINFEEMAVISVADNDFRGGTAIVLDNSRGRTTLLTASHTVTYPDTILHYMGRYESDADNLVEAVSLLDSASYFVLGEEGLSYFDLVLNDTDNDLALMVSRWPFDENPRFRPLSIPPGNASRLDWTDLIYAVGYPQGTQMVTRGVVSPTTPRFRRNFIMDASFNRGFSGGAIFAVRRDGSGLEWVGILTMAAAETETYLSPGFLDEQSYYPDVEYLGPSYIRRVSRIKYGVTYAVGIDEIQSFFRQNRREIREMGLRLPGM